MLLMHPLTNQTFKILGLLILSCMLTACDQASKSVSDSKEKTAEKPKFEIPKDQYGLEYWVGNLGGKPVKLPQTIFKVWEYDDSPDLWGGTEEEKKAYKKRPETYDSVMADVSFEMRYTDGVLYEFYYQAPPKSRDLYRVEHDRDDSKWLRVNINAGRRSGGLDLDALWGSIIKKKAPDSYFNYHATGKELYGLSEYRLNTIGLSNGVSEDIYMHKNNQGHVTAVIYCANLARRPNCEHNFLLLPDFKAKVVVRYRRSNLKDWQLIQSRVKPVLQQYVVNKK